MRLLAVRLDRERERRTTVLGRLDPVLFAAFAAALAVAVPVVLSGCGAPGRAERPNIVLITVESLRADHLGCYGYARATTPNLDSLAGESVRFENAYSLTSWTLPSHASILTGLPPSALRVLEPHDRLADSYETIAELLSENGYYCLAFLSGPFLRAPYNMGQGFSRYDDSPSAVSTGNAHGDVTNPVMEEKVTSFFRSLPPRPFFLFAYFWDVHYDFIPPAPYDTLFVEPGMERFDIRGFDQNSAIAPGMSEGRLAYVVSQYDGEIRATDEMLGRIFRVMREEGLWKNTAILLTADHGEEFFEHGEKGHKNNLHRESVRVPLLLKRPGAEGPAETDARLVTLLDVFPTLAEIGGARLPGATEGKSLLGSPSAERDVFFELRLTHYGPSPADGSLRTWTADMFAASDGREKYIRLPRDRGELLYDLAADPGETRVLTGGPSADLPRWREKVDRWHERAVRLASDHGEGGEAPLTADERERLEALGYIRIAPRTAP